MLRTALSADAGVEIIERLVSLQERSEARHASAQLARALHDFGGEVHAIVKNRRVDHATRKGSRRTYSFATLDSIAEAIREPLRAAGLSYGWDVTEDDWCVCTVRHVDGAHITARHPIRVEAGPGMNAAQAYAAALTYAKRYSLLSVLAITTADEDVDGQLTGEPITDHQAAILDEHVRSRAEESGIPYTDVLARFLRLLAVESLHELDAARYDFALTKVQERARG